MRNTLCKIACGITLAAMAIFIFSSDGFADRRIVFGGGPSGGTFQVVAEGIQAYPPVAAMDEFDVTVQASAGSLDNLRGVNSGQMDFGTVYSGHVWLGKNGMIANDPKVYENVMPVSWLYGAPAQLVVRADSGVKSVKQLVGKNVGVGKRGSGAYANCRLFFTHMGVWDKIGRKTLGYTAMGEAFLNGKIDAFWLFTAFPNKVITNVAQNIQIELVDLEADAMESGFYNSYPYMAPVVIPAGTYQGVGKAAMTFQDSAIWVANSKVTDGTVYNLLSKIYTNEGLAHMKARKKTFKNMSVENGIKGIITPIHWGARKFWKEKGVMPK